jgi:D-alanyl-D-alanine carboxypeptidase/D-alanyl-D-alanine-endopeptidase (penicillin-binding protein 4)
MLPVRRLIVVCLAVACLGSAADADLRATINELVRSQLNEQAEVGICVLGPDEGDIWYQHRAADLLVPASNMKLLSTGAALDMLGPEYVFETTLYRDGDRLLLLGSGDPALADPVLLEEMGVSVEEIAAVWVQAVTQAGMEQVEEILVDASIFDDQYIHPSWPISELNRSYSPEVAGVNFHLNVLTIYSQPTRPGQAPRLSREPVSPWIEIPPGATTVSSGRNTIWFSRKYMTNEIRVHGKVAAPSQRGDQVTLHDMPQFVGDLLADRLEQAGVVVGGVRVGLREDPMDPGTPLAVIRTPLATVLQRCNRDSENLYAEALIKRCGYELTGEPGSWATGAAAVRHVLLERVGPESAAVVIDDGSGLSRENRISAELLAEWLQSFIDDETLFPVYSISLPEGGEEGTLRRRFDDVELAGSVRAKSGYLLGISCLSGYVISEAGEVASFSILVNNIKSGLTVRQVKRFHEAIVAAIDERLAERAEEIVQAEVGE